MTPQQHLAAAKAERGRRDQRRRAAVRNLAEFVRQAWHVLEHVPLDWSWHHRVLCDHIQLLIEEWRLAGMTPEVVDATLALWEREAWDETRREQVLAMRAHWERPTDEYVITLLGEKQHGCGRGKYLQRAQDLVVNIGPISLKSRIVMVFAVGWVWLSVPGWEVFCSSGTPSNVTRDSIDCRKLVVSPWYRSTFDVTWSTFDVQLEIQDDLDRIDKWGTTAGGGRAARGVSSSVTGVHADAIFVDDADDAAGVWSEADRKTVNLFTKAVGNRLKDPTRPVRLWMQQNLHHLDQTSQLVAAGTPRLAIPVEWKESLRAKMYTAPYGFVDPRTGEGANMQPSRYTAQFLAAELKRLGSHGYNAQYNCNPASLDGGLIKRKWWRFYLPDEHTPANTKRPDGCQTEVPAIPKPIAFDRIVIGGDFSNGTVDGDFNAIPAWGQSGSGRFLLPDFWWEQGDFPEAKKQLKRIAAAHPGAKIVIEKAANGWAVVQDLGGTLPGLVGVNPRGSKASRQNAISPTIESGCGYIPLGHPRMQQFVDEFAGATGHDDMSDASAYAIIDINRGHVVDPGGGVYASGSA